LEKRGETNDEGLHCHVILKSKDEDVPIMKPSDAEEEDEVEFSFGTDANLKSFNSKRVKIFVKERCNLEWSVKPTKVDGGFRMIDIPYEKLFAPLINCPEGANLIFYKTKDRAMKKPLGALDMTCKKDADDGHKIKWFITGEDSNPLPDPLQPSEIKYVGCKQRGCKLCADPDFGSLQKVTVGDGCFIYKCPTPWMKLNNDEKLTEAGNITCAPDKSDAYDWRPAGLEVQVKKASCPDKVPCPPLKCVDGVD
ncbi:hypothetical protein PMAYCL1PPCAC_08771, partial [Pristionchus mayeri]